MSVAIEFYVDACCWAASGWENANEFSVQDATKVARHEARVRWAREAGERYIDAGAWKRYIRPFDAQEIYEWWVEHEDWRDDDRGGGWETHPDARPQDWEEPDPYSEDRPYWQFCTADHPDAHPVWICGMRSDGAPPPVRRGACAS